MMTAWMIYEVTELHGMIYAHRRPATQLMFEYPNEAENYAKFLYSINPDKTIRYCVVPLVPDVEAKKEVTR